MKEIILETAVGWTARQLRTSIGAASRPIFGTAEQFQIGARTAPRILRRDNNLATFDGANWPTAVSRIITFSFFIPNQPEGMAKQNLPQFMQELAASKIKLQALSASADRRRFKTYCAPEVPAKLRAFLKSTNIRAKERGAFLFQYADMKSCLSAFDKIAISAFDIKAFDAITLGNMASGFIWSDKSFQ